MAVAKDEYFSRLRRLFLRLAFFTAQGAATLRPAPGGGAAVLAICFGAGVGIYFSVPAEPPLWVGFMLLAVGFCAGLAVIWRGGGWGVSTLSAAVLMAGFGVAQLHAHRLSAPVWERQTTARLTGTIAAVEEREKDRRLILTDLRIDRTSPDQTPARVRLSVRRAAAEGENIFAVGQRVSLRAGLMPPPVPSIPGGYDFQRMAWFEQIGAVGYSLGPVETVGSADGTVWRSAADAVERLRLSIGARLRDGIGGSEGAVAAALVTGEMGAIPEQTVAVYRASGLAHMLSISGLHFSLAAATVLVILRGGLALIPPVALRWDIKKISALLALVMMTVYLVISGVSIPAQRAYVMGAVMVAAILVDRSALSLHVLGLSALLVLMLRPDALLSPSFQMSYAAVLVLIVTFDHWGPRWSRWRGRAQGPVAGSLRAGVVYTLGVVVSTSVAGLATAPFSIFHFQTYSVYGVLANMTAIPLVGGSIMPGLLLAVLLMPLGWEALTFPVLRWSLWAVEQVAAGVADLPGAVLTLPPLSMVQLLLAVTGFLLICLWSGRLRWAGALVMAGAFGLSAVTYQLPVAVLHGDGVLQAVRSGDGLALSPGRANGFARDGWTRRWGTGPDGWEERGFSPAPEGGDLLACDRAGCLYTPAGAQEPLIALARSAAAVAEDCGHVPVMVSAVSLPPWSALRQGCGRARIIDSWVLRRFGTHVVYWDGPTDGDIKPRLRIETVADAQGDRPWSLLGQERARRNRQEAKALARQAGEEEATENEETGNSGEAAPVPQVAP